MSLPLLLERTGILLRREVKVRAAYRMTAILSVVNGVAGIVAYGLLGNSAAVSVTMQSYGMSLASYLVSGVAFSPIVANGLGMFSQHAGPSQIEEVMVTPTGLREFVLLSSIFPVLTTLGSATLFFLVSIPLFSVTFTYDLPVLFATISLGILSSVGLGFIGLGFQLVYKQTSILSWLLYSLTGIVGNMLVPVEVLPGFVQAFSYVTPHYYFFTGIRLALGSGVANPGSLLGLFTLYTLVLLVSGLLAVDRGLRFVRRHGTHRWT